MFTPSLASASLRSALPPTLQPNAIAAMAPPASRGVSAVLAFGCYALLGGAGFLALQLKGHVAVLPPVITYPVQLREENAPLLLPAPPMKAASGAPAGGAPSEPVRLLPAATPIDPVPVTPTTTNSVDRSLDGSREPTGSGGTGTDSRVSNPGGSLMGFPIGTGPTELPTGSVHILSQVTPIYPPMAKLARIQGPVVLRMTIDTQGVPTEVQVASGQMALQAEAMRAARLWRFAAATVNGQAVAATFQLTIIFSLR